MTFFHPPPHWACQFCQIVISEDEEALANLALYLLKSLSWELFELLLQVDEHVLNRMHVCISPSLLVHSRAFLKGPARVGFQSGSCSSRKFCMRRSSLEGTLFFSTISFGGKVYSVRPWSSSLKDGLAIWRSLRSFSRARGVPAASSFFKHLRMILAVNSCNL